MGALAGIVEFSSGLVQGGTAQLSLFRVARGGTGADSLPTTEGWRFTFVKTGTEWVIKEMKTHLDR
jgi:hypothetical protein